MLRDGEPCNHPGCLSHISHPCEGCGRIGGRIATGAISIEGLKDAFAESLYGPLEEQTYQTYAGVTRSTNPEAANWKMNEGEPSVLTIEKLAVLVDTIPKMPKFPPHYRCNQPTYDALKAQFARRVPMSEFPAHMRHLSAVYVHVDNKVPEGEFWPPEGWEP